MVVWQWAQGGHVGILLWRGGEEVKTQVLRVVM